MRSGGFLLPCPPQCDYTEMYRYIPTVSFFRFSESASYDAAKGRDSNDEDGGRQPIKVPFAITKPAIYGTSLLPAHPAPMNIHMSTGNCTNPPRRMYAEDGKS